MRGRAVSMVVAAVAGSSGCGDISDGRAERGPVTATTVSQTAIGPSNGLPATPAATAVPAGVVDCGTARLASGWPTTTAAAPGYGRCILDAFAAGQPAVYVERSAAPDDRHIEITTFEIAGVRAVRVTVDARAADPPGGVTVGGCSNLVEGPGRLSCIGPTAELATTRTAGAGTTVPDQ